MGFPTFGRVRAHPIVPTTWKVRTITVCRRLGDGMLENAPKKSSESHGQITANILNK